MNTNKKNIMSGGWILCPSKTFAGKFYYFNVLNGEAAWSLCDAEKKIIKNPIPKVQDSHHHPEPSSPPTEPLIPLKKHPPPVFGQSGFLRVPPPEGNVIWAPIQSQVPKAPEKQGLKAKMIWDFNKDLFIHATSKPLSHRFVNFENPVINFDKDNKVLNVLQFNKYCKELRNNDLKATKSIASNTEFPISYSEIRPRQLIKESVFNIEVPSETPVQDIEPEADCNRVYFGMSLETDKGNCDLRNLLLAKRKKNEPKINSEVESKKQKIMKDASNPKKRVTFNLDNNDISSFDEDELNNREKCAVTMKMLRDLAGTILTEWYIVVDTEVLLDEFPFIDSLVQIDPECKLVVPSAVMSELHAASRGAHATVPRTVLRRLDAPSIIVQSEDDTRSISPNEGILKSCIDSSNRNIHVVLITKDLELLTTAKCYPIHCYHISNIKNGLAPKPKEYKQNMKITIRNTEGNFMEKGPAENVFVDENLNEKVRCFNQNKVNLISNEGLTPNYMNFSSGICMKNSKVPVNDNSIDKLSIITKQHQQSPNMNTKTINSQKEKMNLQKNSITYSMKNKPLNSQDSNINALPLNHFFNTTKVFNYVAKNEVISNGKTDGKDIDNWREAASDATETTIEMDMSNLHIKDKYNINKNKKPNEILFKTSTPKTNEQIKNRTYICRENEQDFSEIQKSNATPLLQKRGNDSYIQKPLKTPFQNRDSKFEKSISKEPQFENGTESLFEIDVFKKPNRPNWTKDTSVDLSNFYVKSKIMDNRLKERMDEYICSYKQIMEEFLSSILERLSPYILKCMTPPWSLYEALQCAKNVYKDHVTVKKIVDQLSEYLYEAYNGIDKMKKIITPNEFIKALGCGIHLVKYLKKILQPSTEMLDSEQQLMDMLRHVEDPTELTDVNDLLVKTPVINTEFKETRQNFVKNRTDIISYLRKHYPEWQNYEEIDNKMKIVRTFGRNLKMLKLQRINEIEMGVDDVMNVDGATGAHVETDTNVGIVATNKLSLECTKLPTFGEAPTKNVGIFVMKETDCNTEIVESECVNIVQEECTTSIKKQNDQHTDCDSKNTEKIEAAKPKTKSIFDFVKPKAKNLENQRKFQIDSEILGVKISVPNNKNIQKCRENNDCRETNESCIKDNEKNKCVRKLNMNKDDKNTKNEEKSKTEDTKTGIKIVRNIYLIEEFEKRLKNKQNLYIDGLEYSIILDNDNDTHFNDTDKNTNGNNDEACTDDNSYKDNHHSSLKQLNGQSMTKYDQNHKAKENEINKTNMYNNDKNKITQINSKENGPAGIKNLDYNEPNDANYSKIHGKDPKNDVNDPKNDGNDHKNDKDDMTIDSGFGNESPRVYCVVKSFSTELENSLELIHTFIDGSLQEFREGKLSHETKKTFRLRALKANFLITKIISRLEKISLKNTCDTNEKKISKNIEAINKCLEQAEILQNSLTMILSVTNEGCLEELNSSMSLNLSS